MNEWNKFKKAVATNKMEKKVVIFFQKLHQNKIIEWKMNEKKITKTHWTYGSFFSVWKRIYSFFVLFCFKLFIWFILSVKVEILEQNKMKQKKNQMIIYIIKQLIKILFIWLHGTVIAFVVCVWNFFFFCNLHIIHADI